MLQGPRNPNTLGRAVQNGVKTAALTMAHLPRSRTPNIVMNHGNAERVGMRPSTVKNGR